jgi:hypothetical protein
MLLRFMLLTGFTAVVDSHCVLWVISHCAHVCCGAGPSCSCTSITATPASLVRVVLALTELLLCYLRWRTGFSGYGACSIDTCDVGGVGDAGFAGCPNTGPGAAGNFATRAGPPVSTGCMSFWLWPCL